MHRAPVVALALALLSSVATAQVVVFENGFDDGTPAAWSHVQGPPATTFRIGDIDLRDPHVFVDLFGCRDVTDQPYLVVPAVNDQLAASLNGDDDGDGYLDLSPLLRFRPFVDGADGLLLELTEGDCTTPDSCVVAPDAEPAFSAYDRPPGGPCLAAEPGTTGGYSPAVPAPGAPCWASRTIAASFDLDGTPVPLDTGRLGATIVGADEATMVSGLMRGFLPETVADSILIDIGIGTIPLSSLLPGGTGCCAPGDDRDTVEGVVGWWFYLEFTAAEIVVPDP